MTTVSDHKHWLLATASTEDRLEHLQHQYTGYCHALVPFLADAKKNPVTLYDFLSTKPTTSKFIQLIDQCPQIKELLQNSNFSSTVWAPSDTAFQKLGKKLPEENVLTFLQAHISPRFLPIYFLLTAPTMDLLLLPGQLNGAQRVTVRPSLTGLGVNSNATVIAPDNLTTNGLVHIIDQVLLPRPAIYSLIAVLPPHDFDLFQTAVQQSKAAQAILHDQSRRGGVVFIPTNQAFRKLPEDVQTFLFSDQGATSLQALLLYHIVINRTLYSNRFYDIDSPPEHFIQTPEATPDHTIPTPETQADSMWRVLKGTRRFSLSTCLAAQPLVVTVTRHGGLISMRVNEIANIIVQDGLSSDGVCHIVDSVLFPPPQNEGDTNNERALSVEDVISRLVQLL
ncbi:FAS1 domain-containing protein [Penicillium canariense]|uniref:FAS1 domain-containing protein n=1 Tax=Penicillium canariense TaxID=189055 RepID=A0A9W9LMP4_9EURO|nr:FAS1 domain-containing protein [Penicillium canariense]KAJ5167109.1 FAS1 domain-containing protein [Penicillium canariense]